MIKVENTITDEVYYLETVEKKCAGKYSYMAKKYMSDKDTTILHTPTENLRYTTVPLCTGKLILDYGRCDDASYSYKGTCGTDYAERVPGYYIQATSSEGVITYGQCINVSEFEYKICAKDPSECYLTNPIPPPPSPAPPLCTGHLIPKTDKCSDPKYNTGSGYLMSCSGGEGMLVSEVEGGYYQCYTDIGDWGSRCESYPYKCSWTPQFHYPPTPPP